MFSQAFLLSQQGNISKVASNISVPVEGATILEVPSQHEKRVALLLFVIFSGCIGSSIWLGFYNIFLSPTVNLPGHQLAALMGLSFPIEIKKMHDEYGQSSESIQADSPSTILNITTFSIPRASKPYNKPARWEHRFCIPGSTFSTPRTEVQKLSVAAQPQVPSSLEPRSENKLRRSKISWIKCHTGCLSTESAGKNNIRNIQDVSKEMLCCG
ncbi:hypothetical protein NHQ30_001036 [Ciborinia camelliae]|nr:hypothetical protein NHQ30_001036 [Ciborinia camelliae]